MLCRVSEIYFSLSVECLKWDWSKHTTWAKTGEYLKKSAKRHVHSFIFFFAKWIIEVNWMWRGFWMPIKLLWLLTTCSRSPKQRMWKYLKDNKHNSLHLAMNNQLNRKQASSPIWKITVGSNFDSWFLHMELLKEKSYMYKIQHDYEVP